MSATIFRSISPFSRLRAGAFCRSGFTLVEILIALSLLGLLTVMLFTSFHSVTRAWETGRSVIDASGHSDYLMEQLSAALRSAYTPGTGEKYGLIFLDDGDDERARDVIEWSKVGPALVGEDAEFAEVPHRIRVSITEPEGDFPGGFTVRAWRQDLQLDAFDPEEESYIENIIRLNKGKVATFYMTYNDSLEYRDKVYRGIIQAAGKDHIVISDTRDGKRYILLLVYLDYIEFDEPINYEYPIK